MNKYNINYPLLVLSYNIYYKSMLGLDENFLPKQLSQDNVKRIINSYDFDIIGLQEVACIDKLFDKNDYNYVRGKSGKEYIMTFFKNKFKILKTKTTDFKEGRPIQLTLTKNNNEILLVVNLHAPHEYNNFRNYKGEKTISNKNYSLELINILNFQINDFLEDDNVDRIILIGDFNEFLQNETKDFDLIIKNKVYKLKTDNNLIKSCCYPNFLKEGDLIFDSKNFVKLSIVSTIHPASDHYPVMSII